MSLLSLEVYSVGTSPEEAADFLPYARLESIRYSRAINGVIGTLEFTLDLPYGAPTVDVGREVILTSSDGVEFTGFITRANPTIANEEEDGVQQVRWACTCQDDTRLLESESVGIERFTNISDKVIIDYLFATYLPTVSTANVQAVAVIPYISLTGKTVRQCMEEIAAITQAIWYVEPEKELWYHDSSYRVAPFSIAEDYDDISTEGARVDGFSLTREFYSPCNSAEVRNIPNEEVLEASYEPGASGDDGYTTLTSGAYPPTGTATENTDGNSIRVERSRINDETPEDHDYTPDSGAGGSDGMLYAEGSGWPPSISSLTLYDALEVLAVQASYLGGAYIQSRVMLGFDTSAIPDDAEVMAATLTLKDCAVSDEDSGSVIFAGWMDKDVGDVELEDWDDADRMVDGYRSAFSETAIAGLTGTQVFALGSAALGVQKTKYSWLWMTISPGAVIPTGTNYLSFASKESGANSPILNVTYRQAGTTYTVACAHVQFDTSALPADAEIQSAVLWLKPSAAPVNADSGSVGVEWYAASNWPIGAADHSNTASNAAGGYKALSQLALDTSVSLPLTGGAANINLAGYTGIRIHAYTAATPTGENSVEFYSQDSTGDAPRLVVNYISGGSIVGTYEDAASQALYGIYHKAIINASLTSEAEADLQAEALVLAGAWPQQAMRTTVERAGLKPGQWCQVNFPALGINEAFLIRALSVGMEAEEQLYSIDVGDFRPDLIAFLRTQAIRETSSTAVSASSTQIIVSAQQYGAVGDGLTDDTAAITAALAAAKTVALTSGNYLVTSPIVLTSGQTLTSAGTPDRWRSGVYDCRISYTGTGQAVLVQPAAGQGRDSITIRGIQIDGTGSTGSVDGIYLDGSAGSGAYIEGVLLDGVSITNFPRYQLHLNTTVFDITLRRFTAMNPARDSSHLVYTEGTNVGQITCDDCWLSNYTANTWAFKVGSVVTNARFVSGTIAPYNKDASGIWVHGGLDVYGTHIEGITTDPADAGVGLRYTGSNGARLFASVVSYCAIGVQIGNPDSKTLSAAGVVLGSNVNNNALDIQIVDGGSRSGLVLSAGGSPTISDLRDTVDGIDYEFTWLGPITATLWNDFRSAWLGVKNINPKSGILTTQTQTAATATTVVDKETASQSTTDVYQHKTSAGAVVARGAAGGKWKFKRMYSNQGTALQTSDFSLSAGWGSTASVTSVRGTDQAFSVAVSSDGTGQSANPTITLNFVDGAFDTTPVGICKIVNGDQNTVPINAAYSTTQLVLTFTGTPVDGEDYDINCLIFN